MAPRERFPLAVVGPGALGSFFAQRLSKTVRIAVIGRGSTNVPEADWVIILVKAYDTAAAARVARRMKPKGIVSLQNGLIDEVPQGVTTAAAYRVGKRMVPVTTGRTLLPPGFEALARLLRGAGFNTKIAKEIHAARLQKLLVNVCVNPVTAAFGVRNGALARAPYARFAEALAREAAPVLAAEGLKTTPAAALRRVMAVAKATAANRSSMLQDLTAGRKTEIEEITGALLRLARRHRLAVPTHAAFHQIIRIMQSR